MNFLKNISSIESISSTQNHRVKYWAKLRKGNFRRQEKVYLIEGFRELKLALQNNIEFIELAVVVENIINENEQNLIKEAALRSESIFSINKQILSKSTYRENPSGFLAITKQNNSNLNDIHLTGNPLILIVENIEKPGNLGALLRTSDAVGVDFIILVDPVTDIYNPNIIRSSQGSVFSVPFVIADGMSLNSWLKKNEVQMIAASPASEKLYWEIDFKLSTALLVGSENEGLSSYWNDFQNVKFVTVPMQGQVDSLNVSVASSVILYEGFRQRSQG